VCVKAELFKVHIKVSFELFDTSSFFFFSPIKKKTNPVYLTTADLKSAW